MTVPEPGPPAEGDSDAMGSLALPGMMKLYYGWLFPHQELYKWLSYGKGVPGGEGLSFQNREFCFTLDGDVFVRYQSFKDGPELLAALRDRVPSKIDIGPVYNVDPQRRSAYMGGAAGGFVPVERELVFDIDLTDYDDVRECGKGGHICGACWPLMATAIQVLDAGLREDFGFRHVLWVYSGRRGVHAWVCDERARRLTDEQRSAVAAYFSVYRGQQRGGAKLALGLDDHPAVRRAAEALRTAFEEHLLPGQHLLEDEAHAEAMLGLLPGDALRDSVRARWAAGGCAAGECLSLWRWRALEMEVEAEKEAVRRANARDARGVKALDRALREIIFTYTYPRLDMEVSKKMNHLLKAPFCVHPKTGRVCVPIDPAAAWEFDPEAVPTVGGLLAQLNAAGRGDAGAPAQGADWRSTDMAGAVALFRSCFLDGLREEQRGSAAEHARQAAAQPSLAW